MKLRQPRTKVEKRGYLADTIALCHPKMFFVIFCVLTIGHFMAPGRVDLGRWALTTFGVLIAVLSAYRLNELHDRTTATSIPRSHHKALAGLFIAIAVTIAIILALFYVWWILILALIGTGLIVLYNLDVHPLLHNKPVYALTWGTLPLVFSEMAQSGNLIPTIPTLLMGIWAGLLAVYTLWLWGPMTCGRMSVCSRAKGKPIKRLCHSPVLRCRDRVVMPREVHEHMKALIDLNIFSVMLITLTIVWLKMVGL